MINLHQDKLGEFGVKRELFQISEEVVYYNCKNIIEVWSELFSREFCQEILIFGRIERRLLFVRDGHKIIVTCTKNFIKIWST